MAFGQVAGLSDPLEDYAGFFLKMYEQGTTTPLSMATDAAAGTLIAKAEVSSGGAVPIGFIKTAGNAIFIPYLDEAYDGFLFPTEAEADANDLTNAIQIADNVEPLITSSNFTVSASSVVYIPQAPLTGTDAQAALDELAAVTLTTGRTYFVRTDGNDSNDGLSNTAEGAFLTLQKAADTIELLELNGNQVIVTIGAGTYTAGVIMSGAASAAGQVFFIGDTVTPSNVNVNTTSSDCFLSEKNASFGVRGVKMTTTTSGNCLNCTTGAIINFQSVDFGSAVGHHMDVGTGGVVFPDGVYSISGGAEGHWHVGSFGLIACGVFTIPISNTPAFSSFFAGVAQGTISCGGVTFSGTGATGRRYLAHFGGHIITTQGIASLPGDVIGESSAAGFFLGGDNTAWDFIPDVNSANSITMKSRNFNAGTLNTHISLTNGLTEGKGFFFFNGDGCFSSGLTHLGGDVTVTPGTGTDDGMSVRSKASIAVGFEVMAASGTGITALWRRRLTDGGVHQFYRDNTAVGSISVTTVATAYNTSSDPRLKTAFSPIVGALAMIEQSVDNGYIGEFDFITEPGVKVWGYNAHLLVDNQPGFGGTEGEGSREAEIGTIVDGKIIRAAGVDQSKRVPILEAAIYELLKRVEALENP